jgi:signal transduction histidine kinase
MSELEFPQSYAEGLGDSVISRRRPARPAAGTILGLTGAILCAAAVALVTASVPSDAAFGRGLVELLIVGTPVVAGLYALRIGANVRFAFALIWVGFAWSLTALSESSLSIPYTIGRLSTWLVFPGVVYLLLAFPTGRISAGRDRALFVGVLALSVVLFYGTAPLVLAYPPHTLWATCTTDCPANAVALVDTPPAFLSNVILVREWLVMLLWLGLFWSMFRRFRAASPLRRRAMAPVFGTAAVLGVLHISFHASRELGAPAQTVIDLSSAWTLAIVGVCAAFLLGLFWRRMLLGRTLARLGPALRDTDSPAEVRDALAAALSDPSLELLVFDAGSGAWHDAYERPRSWPRPLPAGRAATEIGTGDGAEDVVLLHDVALCDEQELLDGAAAIVLAGWRHKRLAADLAQAMEDLEQSRRRIAEAAVHERARIERDLHDGAQQRLVALRINVALAAERFEADPEAGVAEIRELGFEVDRALEELRSIAHGVYPAVLADLGLAAALRSLGRHGALPIHVADGGLERHAVDVESAVYFTCVEALQNAMKHAEGATGVWIRLRQSRDTLDFEVLDDGRGMPPHAEPGQGLRNMRDRIEALGGRLTVDTRPGRGARVVGSVPLAEA